MFKKQAESLFKREYPNWKELSPTDRRIAWNDYVESLYQDGFIKQKQAYTWDQPKFIKG